MAPICFAGTVSSGGGDVIYCGNQSTVFSLDYIIENSKIGPKLNVVPVTTTQESLSRISKLLKVKLPHLHRSFQGFRSHLNNETDYSKRYIWKLEYFELKPLDDENLDGIPISCSFPYGFEIRQAVIRDRYANGQVVFNFNRDVSLALDPLQKSFLLVHEWLWDISIDVAKNRKMNYFLHSKEFDKLSPREMESLLLDLGLNQYNGK